MNIEAEVDLDERSELVPNTLLRCIQFNAPVPNAVCGRKQSCASCCFPYQIGECSDLVEN